MTVIRPFVIGLLLASTRITIAQAQSATQNDAVVSADTDQAKPPEFEVATIKPSDPAVPHGQGVEVFPAGRVVINGVNLKTLIMIAFNLSYWQITGGDGWAEKDDYDVDAKAPENAQPPEFNLRHTLFGMDDERLRQMLQSLLIDRFQLKFHRETKSGTVYLLERSGKPLKLQPGKVNPTGASSDSGTFGSIGWAGHWVLADTTMAHLAKFAADFYLHRPVVDRTGLAGTFNYWSPNYEDKEDHWGDPIGSFDEYDSGSRTETDAHQRSGRNLRHRPC